MNNIASIGLFTGASSETIPTSIEQVVTTGHYTAGKGSARYNYDAALGATYVAANPRSAFMAGGRVFKLSLDQTITPYMFGVTGERWGTYDGPNDLPGLQSFFNFIANNACASADTSCECQIAGPLDIKASGVWQTLTLKGLLRVRGSTFVTDRAAIEIGDMPNHVHWQGGIHYHALGAAAYAERQTAAGIVFNGNSRLDIDFVGAAYCKGDGIVAAAQPGIDNNNLTNIGRIHAYACGCGYDDVAMTWEGTIGEIIQYGQLGSTSQRSRISLADFVSLPSPVHDLYRSSLGEPGEGGQPRTDAMYMAIAGSTKLYKIVYVDRVNNALWVYPRIPDATPFGTKYRLVTGVGFHKEGGDSNLIRVGIVETGYCGGGMADHELYGSAIDQFHCDAVGFGRSLGSRYYSASLSHSTQQCYFEATSYADIVVGSLNVQGDLGVYLGGQNYPKIVSVAEPTGDALGNPVRYWSGISKLKMWANGTEIFDEGNIARYCHTLAWELGGNNPASIRTNGNCVVTLSTASSSSSALVEGRGLRGGSLHIHGTATNNAPAGTIKFVPPTGFTVNGAANHVFAAPAGPRSYRIWMDLEATNFVVMDSDA